VPVGHRRGSRCAPDPAGATAPRDRPRHPEHHLFRRFYSRQPAARGPDADDDELYSALDAVDAGAAVRALPRWSRHPDRLGRRHSRPGRGPTDRHRPVGVGEPPHPGARRGHSLSTRRPPATSSVLWPATRGSDGHRRVPPVTHRQRRQHGRRRGGRQDHRVRGPRRSAARLGCLRRPVAVVAGRRRQSRSIRHDVVRVARRASWALHGWHLRALSCAAARPAPTSRR